MRRVKTFLDHANETLDSVDLTPIELVTLSMFVAMVLLVLTGRGRL